MAFHLINSSEDPNIGHFDERTAFRRPLVNDTTLWRYIKLSGLLNLLNGCAFIPKISELQKGDRNESKVTTQVDNTSPIARSEVSHKENRDWLLSKSTWEGKLLTCSGSEQDPMGRALLEQSLLEEIWLRELAKRRCAWCWHESAEESVAQWKIYGGEGVAIRSDVGAVLNSLCEIGAGVYGRIKYLKRQHQSGIFEEYPDLKWHPYFAKQKSYEHEKEVRFVFRDDREQWLGCDLDIVFADLVKEIRVSPFLPASGATAVMKQIQRLLPEGCSIPVNVSSEQSDSICPRDEETDGERWGRHVWKPVMDDALPPVFQCPPPKATP